MRKKKLRPMGQITQDLENLLLEMTDAEGHDLQHGETIALVFNWLIVHAPHARETYTADGSHPVMFYGHKDEK